MNKAMFKLAAKLLRLAVNEFVNHNNNDLLIDDTPENRELVTHLLNLEEGEELQTVEGKILITDWVAMTYCADALDEIEIPIEYIPDGA